MFKTLLIANRGEIACRIIRTARAMGIRTIAVYSEADRGARHVEMADMAVTIGEPAALKSYLNQKRIINAAQTTGADAVHPGYGFLSENPEFALSCEQAGLVFIGPPVEVIREMGIKSRAKAIMADADIPVVPGYMGDSTDIDEITAQAQKIGFPVMIKADRGGGGKGIRSVTGTDELHQAIAGAAREATNAFGDNSLLLEKQIVGARHIEVQIFRDTQGNTLHLFERDCSLQRRHQKILEEAPAPNLSENLRPRLHETAVNAAETIGYIGAGTVEFLVTGDNIYFLEINTRLQVEHPVTEIVTGQDLVRWQLLVAAGEPLPLQQDELQIDGHGIEVRIYAEDPANDFRPATGKIHHLVEPDQSVDVRIDSGIRKGDEVTPYYDPILAKLIVKGVDRAEAITGLQHALAGYQLAGISSNLDFLCRLAADEAFCQGSYTAAYLDEHLSSLTAIIPPTERVVALAALYVLLRRQEAVENAAKIADDRYSPWNDRGGFRLNMANGCTIHLVHHGREYQMHIERRKDAYLLTSPNNVWQASRPIVREGRLLVNLSGENLEATIVFCDNALTVFYGGTSTMFSLPDENPAMTGGGRDKDSLRAPIPGKVTAILTSTGSRVKAGDGLLVIEAMKMEYTIKAPADGILRRMLYKVGDRVEEGERLADFLTGEE